MVAARVLAPHTTLATTRWWHTTTLAEEYGVEGADEDALYSAMDWLLEHQSTIERKLAARHLREGALALYDLSSSYFEGTQCPLARLGHSRDGKKNKLQVNYGLLTARSGCPVAVSVYEGNTADVSTLMPEVRKLREQFHLEHVVLVGDRGTISHKAIGELREIEGLGWMTALKSGQIRSLIEGEALQLGLFDERSLFEFSHPDYPGERLIACRNLELAKLRAHKRHALLEATRKELEKVQTSVAAGRVKGKDKIGVRVGRIVNKYKVAKHFELTIEEQRFEFTILEDKVAAEAALECHLCDPHRRPEEAHVGGRCGQKLQGAREPRARVPLAEDRGPESRSDPPSARGSHARPHLPVHARLLCRVAHARGLGAAAVRRRKSGGKG